MQGGYVLDFSDRTIGEFFDDELDIDFFDEKYNYASGSKANRMRGFWKNANNEMVSRSIVKLCDYIDTQILTGDLDKKDFSKDLVKKAREIASWLIGEDGKNSKEEDSFLESDYNAAKLELSKVNSDVSKVLIERIDEVRKCINAEASLAAVVLAGSTIEGVLLDCGLKNSAKFLASSNKPIRSDGSNIPINQWNLDSLIKVAHDIGIVDKNVNNFSNQLRNFRNYIHPNKQASEGFSPDKRTAAISLQVLMACIENLQRAKANGKIL